MVRITVSFYGVIKQATAEPKVEVELPDNFSVQQLLDSLVRKCGQTFAETILDAHGGLRTHVKMFINKEPVDNYNLDARWNISGQGAEGSVLVLPTNEGG